MHAAHIKSNAHKAVRLALAINFTGRASDLNKSYRMDLFHLWNMENNRSINMGVQVMKWLATQNKDNVICVFIGHLVTALCHGLELEGKQRAKKLIARMEPITVEDLDQVKLTRSGVGDD